MPEVTSKVSWKKYECTGCGTTTRIQTNHYGEIYPFCGTCNTVRVWGCKEPVPEGMGVPEPWKTVKLGDIATIT